MKFHNLLLTVALFLTVGIASAAVVHEESESDSGPYFSTYYEVPNGYYDAGKYDMPSKRNYPVASIPVTVKTNGTGYTVELYDTDFEVYGGAGPTTDNDYWKWHKVLESNAETITLTGTKEIGVKITKDNVVYKSFTYSSSPDPTNQLFTHKRGNTIILDDPSNNVHAEVTFGSPLPTPVITLLIALAFGAAFVLYRSRKQQAEA